MTTIYILLTIIAVGVLLLSEDGKALLNSVWKLLAIAGLGFVAFYLIVGGIAFFQTDSFKWFYNNVFPWIFLGLMILYWIYWLSKNFKNILGNIKKSWVEKRGYSIFVIVLLLIIVCSWVIVPILMSW
jgi:carbon starvation protein CstA